MRACAIGSSDSRARCDALADGMAWKFLYDPARGLFSVGFRLANAEGRGGSTRRTTTSGLGGPAGELHRHRPRRGAAGALVPALARAGERRRRTTLVSWSGSMFEYVMPMLLLRSHPETLVENACRELVRAQVSYGRRHGVPWGISESAFNVQDPHGTYQYKAFGVPGAGLKRGLAEDLVVAPYATAWPRSWIRVRGRELPPARPRVPRPVVRLRRSAGLHAAQHARRRGQGRARYDAPPPRARVLRASPGHEPAGARERRARIADGAALPLGRPRAGDRTAACRSACRSSCR
jgi:hypothetical protein